MQLGETSSMSPTCPICRKNLLGEYLTYSAWPFKFVQSLFDQLEFDMQVFDGVFANVRSVPEFLDNVALLLVRLIIKGIPHGPIYGLNLMHDLLEYDDPRTRQHTVYTISLNKEIDRLMLLSWNGPNHGVCFTLSLLGLELSATRLPYFSYSQLRQRKQRAEEGNGPVAKRTRTALQSDCALITMREEQYKDKMVRKSLHLCLIQNLFE